MNDDFQSLAPRGLLEQELLGNQEPNPIQILADPHQREVAMQMQQLQMAHRSFAPRLSQALTLSSHVGQVPTPESMMAKMMIALRRQTRMRPMRSF